MKSLFFAAIVLMTAIAPHSHAQSVQKGSIEGRLAEASGKPLPYANVRLIKVSDFTDLSASLRSNSSIEADKEGRFRFDDLNPGTYVVFAEAPGYVQEENISAKQSRYYKLGDFVTIAMLKGGVITGMVTDANGRPVMEALVKVSVLRESDSSQFVSSRRFERTGFTDDRGIYRIFGLPPGAYIVSAQGSAQRIGYNSGQNSRKYQPFFFPSGPRSKAVELLVRPGEEITGIDIRYSDQTLRPAGFKISGAAASVSRTGSEAEPKPEIMVSLYSVQNDSIENFIRVFQKDGKNSYVFENVPDGDYDLFALGVYQTSEISLLARRRVTVKGKDIVGADLLLTSLASIEGRVVLQKEKTADRKTICENAGKTALEETVISVLDEEAQDEEPSVFSRMLSSALKTVAPDDKGGFRFQTLLAGRYRFEFKLPSENWFVHSISLPISAKKTNNIGADGLALKSGDRVKDLTIAIAEGAAALRGKVVPAEGGKLPASVRVHLVPSEKENAGDALRYFEADMERGEFSFAHIPPGRYWLLARPVSLEELSKDNRKPAAWDAAERIKLRGEAEKANQSIELAPCARISNYALRFGSTKKEK